MPDSVSSITRTWVSPALRWLITKWVAKASMLSRRTAGSCAITVSQSSGAVGAMGARDSSKSGPCPL